MIDTRETDLLAIPARSTGRLGPYIASCTADRIAAGGAVASEHDSVIAHRIALSTLRGMQVAGASEDAKTLPLVPALERRTPALFG